MTNFPSSDDDSQHALEIIRRLREAGYTAYLAGGCVRDYLLGKTPKDYDVATSATPETVRDLFGRRRTLAIGASFGVINVLSPRGSAAAPVEVATFRSDGPYSDGRRPDHVAYSDPEGDAQRRDFTINGLFYDPLEEEVIDFVGGQADLKAGLVRAIGDADRRFAEDRLRMLRAVRFAALFGFEIHPQTSAAVQSHAADIRQVSGERIGAEMRRMLASDAAADALRWMFELRLAEQLLPEPLAAAANAPTTLAWLSARQPADVASGLAILAAAAQRDSADSTGRKMLSQLFTQWKLSTAERDAAAEALSAFPTFLAADSLPWSVVQPRLVGRYAATGLILADAYSQIADDPLQLDASGTAGSGPAGSGSGDGVAFCRRRLQWPAEKLNPPPLLDGTQLKQHGFQPGPKFRDILATVRSAQLDNKIQTPEQALELAARC
ncbi:CCA tRNA nucleotidyltransferase [Roseimaritima sediminicola]|uniref:CCA tRNA nucleotidyltransferase n=1 Tax=Roseimaritima sediminicola TaxID=2662066 RepID=UPI0012984E01|nr:CCA tRNA nucleotidyltransferase [Roseimaritima sediminicola]